MLKRIAVGIVIVFVLLGSVSLYIVQEGESALLLRLGKLETSQGQVKVIKPGLHFKVPLIYEAKIFDTRLQTLAIRSSRMVTREKKDVMVDYYVKWRISNLPEYFKATNGDSYQVNTLLEQLFNTVLRAEFGKRNISDLVSGERDDVMAILKKRAAQKTASLGVDVVDVRIKGIDLPENASQSVYRRMRADMQKIAHRHRADGQAQAEAARADADAKVSVIIASAHRDADELKAKAMAESAKMYRAAYSQSPDFFAFYRSLDVYQHIFQDSKNVWILSPDNTFLQYLQLNSKEGNSHGK